MDRRQADRIVEVGSVGNLHMICGVLGCLRVLLQLVDAKDLVSRVDLLEVRKRVSLATLHVGHRVLPEGEYADSRGLVWR